MIPKRAFFFWEGHMSWLRYMTLASFRYHHPDWEATLFTPRDHSDPKMYAHGEQEDGDYGTDYWDRIPDLLDIESVWLPEWETMPRVHRSDHYRYVELAKSGGIYFDMDMLFVKPIDNLYEEKKDFDAWASFSSWNQRFESIACLASSGGGLFEYLADHAVRAAKAFPDFYSQAGTKMWNNIFDHDFRNVLIRFPRTYNMSLSRITPIPDWTKISHLFEPDKVSVVPPSEKIPTLFSVHWYGGSSHAQEYNAEASPTGILSRDCYMTRELLKLMSRGVQ